MIKSENNLFEEKFPQLQLQVGFLPEYIDETIQFGLTSFTKIHCKHAPINVIFLSQTHSAKLTLLKCCAG